MLLFLRRQHQHTMRTTALSYAFVVLALIAGLVKAQLSVSVSLQGLFPFLVLLSIESSSSSKMPRDSRAKEPAAESSRRGPFLLRISEPAIAHITNKMLDARKSGFRPYFEPSCNAARGLSHLSVWLNCTSVGFRRAMPPPPRATPVRLYCEALKPPRETSGNGVRLL